MVLEVHDVQLLVRIVRCDERCRQRDDDQECEDAETPGRGPVAKKAPPPLVPHGTMAQDADELGRHDQGDEQREPSAERHAVTTSTSVGARTRRRGSAMPTSMSASRLPATTTTLAINAVPGTTGESRKRIASN